jgi:hypothetical protein
MTGRVSVMVNKTKKEKNRRSPGRRKKIDKVESTKSCPSLNPLILFKTKASWKLEVGSKELEVRSCGS